MPVRTGSIAEVNLVTRRPTSADAVRDAFREAASAPPLKGVMDVLEEGWPSSRIVGDDHSSIVDLPLVAVQGGTLVSVAAWYDNEWAFATRLAEVAAYLAGRKLRAETRPSSNLDRERSVPPARERRAASSC